tara:strand:+ start:948 stop:1595 length:648 start_codon:yes stop_codon:yes gene_type:complete
MKVETFQGGFDKNLSYLVWCNTTKRAAIIDASVKLDPIIKAIETLSLYVEKILITHSHHDHTRYLDDIVNYFPSIEICKYKKAKDPINKFRFLKHHETFLIGKELITTLHTPGHYPDSVCFWSLSNKFVFTGDTMFVGRSGRTVDFKSNINELYYSIYKILLKLPQDTIIYPGHNYGQIKSISLKDNKILSPFFQCENLDEFIEVMQNYEENRKS